MTRHYLQAIPASPDLPHGGPHAPHDPPAQQHHDVTAAETLTRRLFGVQVDGAGISVERLERDDGASVIYVNAGDLVAFIYTDRCSGHGRSPCDLDTVVIDLHLRTELGAQRLRVLLDGTRARLITVDPGQFLTLAPDGPGKRALELVCGRCHKRLCDIADTSSLLALLDAATSHLCAAADLRGHDDLGEVAESCS
jgi:hypothetical protein